MAGGLNFVRNAQEGRFPVPSATPVKVFFYDDGNCWFAYGTTVPSAVAGYATMGFFYHTDGDKDTTIYVNTGTAASCTFTVMAV